MIHQQFHRMWSFTFISGLICFIVLFACQQQEVPFVPASEEYRTWNSSTTIELNYSIPGHLENYRKIYINDIGYGVQPVEEGEQRTYTYPEGTIIVKEIYEGLTPPAKDQKPVSLTVMIKNLQHPKSQRGWLWVVKDMQTREERVIDYTFCCDCHANANEPHPYGDQNPTGSDRDYVFFPPEHTLPKATPLQSTPTRYNYPSNYSY